MSRLGFSSDGVFDGSGRGGTTELRSFGLERVSALSEICWFGIVPGVEFKSLGTTIKGTSFYFYCTVAYPSFNGERAMIFALKTLRIIKL